MIKFIFFLIRLVYSMAVAVVMTPIMLGLMLWTTLTESKRK